VTLMIQFKSPLPEASAVHWGISSQIKVPLCIVVDGIF
jgi:hypothetical protein